MARGRKGKPVHGWLILDKPSGVTSTQAVGKVKRLFDAAKAGHAGTLDPLATGVLPIALCEATKTVSHVMEGAKSYAFAVRWGVETDTDDSEGCAVKTSPARPDLEQITAILGNFTGSIMQVPPTYSAIKVEGARAYDLAREGEDFELAPRPAHIGRLEVASHQDGEQTVFEADCAKGTYVRALARDMGRTLGCYGHVIELRRKRVGPFRDSHTISLAKLQEIGHSAAGREGLLALLMPVETALDDIPALAISGSDAARLKRGQAVLLRGRDAPILKGPAYAMSRGTLVAICEAEQGELKPVRVFNLNGRA